MLIYSPQSNANAFRLQNQSQTLSPHQVHSIQVQKEIMQVTDTVHDGKYVGDDVYSHSVKMA